jgi:hypothetical protein
MTRAIEFIESGSDTTSHVGGGSWLPSNFPWPMCEGKKMIPLMTIFQDIFITPTIPNNMAITVFTPIDLNTAQIMHQANYCRIQNESECNNHNDNMGMRVILHEIGGKELVDENITTYPKVFFKARNFTNEEENTYFKNGRTREDYLKNSGIYASKVLGSPYWIQGFVSIKEKCAFALQMIESDLSNYNASYIRIFNGGVCYLFLDNNLWKMSHGQTTGKCFIQFR